MHLNINLTPLVSLSHTAFALAGTFLLTRAGQLARAGKNYLHAKTEAIKDPVRRAAAQAGLNLVESELTEQESAIVAAAARVNPEAGAAVRAAIDGIKASGPQASNLILPLSNVKSAGPAVEVKAVQITS